MESYSKIHNFLDRVQTKWNRVLFLQLTYSLLTVVAGCALVSGLYFYFQDPVLSYGFSGLALVLLAWRLYTTRWFSRINRDQAALLAEKKYPELNNSLINASQLQRYLTKQQENKPLFSLSFIQEHLQRTQTAIQNLDPDSVITCKKVGPARNLCLVTLFALITVSLTLPNFWDQIGSQELAQNSSIPNANKKKPKHAVNQLDYSITDLSLTFEYPSYTQLKRKIIMPSEGSIKALPGTEVKITGNSNHPVDRAELVVNNRDQFIMELKNSKRLEGSLILREKGYYQFKVKQPDGKVFLLEKKYPIELEQDKSPQVILFPANPKPVFYETDTVQMFYETHDDFGIRQIDLIAQINDITLKKKIKHFKQSEKDSTGNFSWNLSLENLQPGDEVQYFLEVKDNDNVRGPNTGQSEIYRFTVFDSRKERENLLRLQEELSEKMIALLANGLVEGEILKTTTPTTMHGKKLLSSHADALIDIIGLAQRIKEQAKEFDNFPRSYITLLSNIIRGLTSLREEQIDTINKLQKTILKPTPVSFTLGSVETLNGKMVTHLEQNILYLIKMTNRQKMDQVMDLENQLSKLTEALQDEFENIRDKKASLTPHQLKAQLDKIQQTLQQMMDKLSQQNQSGPDEFLNSKANENMNLEETLASLEKIKNLASQGKMDEALKELKKFAEDMRKLANQLDQAQASMDSMIDNQVMEQINESMAKLEVLEKKQKEVLQETSKINQKLRQNQAKQFDSLIKNFFDELKKDVQAIQSLLEENSSYLDDHRAMIKTRELMQEEAKTRQKIKSLSQKTIDSSLNEDLGNNFKKLNEARRQLSKTVIEMDNLRTRSFQEFKESLPQIKKKYKTLNELTELNDLNEFNLLFKSTYPEIFKWQGNMRSTRNQREDIGDRVNGDLKEVTRLNAEISKKLGSLKRSIETNSKSLLTDKEKNKLNKLAKQEDAMSRQADEMKDLFNKMNQENPLLPPALSQNMGDAKRNLKNAGNRLKSQQVQRGIDSENKALKSLQQTKNLLNEIKNSGSQMSKHGTKETPLQLGTGRRRDPRRGGAPRMQKEQVLLPSEDQYKVPRAFREEILDAMKKQTPKSYERLVNEYYKELVQ
ncbi:MAG: hypothetical protein HN472_01205 [Nitrospina sp.]|jgi:hypothetical protein|nr:hypothetical protein [Nitrospina sp.]MBT3508145.1 hypothetical protein [Nitrospina sp.]MBT3876273.1 hypothetical protein [Nitrospina sp.]MBT4050011.1 hypothetical protein [Nitrospina sp.]MBT4556589.1 hypothetical protein [Nitrospina sp.]